MHSKLQKTDNNTDNKITKMFGSMDALRSSSSSADVTINWFNFSSTLGYHQQTFTAALLTTTILHNCEFQVRLQGEIPTFWGMTKLIY